MCEFEDYLKCGLLRYGFLRVIACIEDPPLIRQTLMHIQRRDTPLNRGARAPLMFLSAQLPVIENSAVALATLA